MTLRELRQLQEWTQAKLAEVAGVDMQVIEDIESGKPVEWAIAASITAKIKHFIGSKAVEGLHIPQKSNEL